MKNFKFHYLPKQNADGSGSLTTIFFDYKNKKHATLCTVDVLPVAVKDCALWHVMKLLKEYLNGTVEWRKKAFDFFDIMPARMAIASNLLDKFKKTKTFQEFIDEYDKLHDALLHIAPKNTNVNYDAFQKRLNLVEKSILEVQKGIEIVYEYQLSFEPAVESVLPF